MQCLPEWFHEKEQIHCKKYGINSMLMFVETNLIFNEAFLLLFPSV